jgi:hypothetical protein
MKKEQNTFRKNSLLALALNGICMKGALAKICRY